MVHTVQGSVDLIGDNMLSDETNRCPYNARGLKIKVNRGSSSFFLFVCLPCDVLTALLTDMLFIIMTTYILRLQVVNFGTASKFRGNSLSLQCKDRRGGGRWLMVL